MARGDLPAARRPAARAPAASALALYLNGQATDLLRGIRWYEEGGAAVPVPSTGEGAGAPGVRGESAAAGGGGMSGPSASSGPHVASGASDAGGVSGVSGSTVASGPNGAVAASGASGALPALATPTTLQAAHVVRCAARRIGSALQTFRALTDPVWADQLRAELGWLAAVLGSEHTYAARLDRLLGALHRLAGAGELPGGGPGGSPGTRAVGAARAAALLQRRLGLARSRAHTAALQALGSGRFHAVADGVAVLASEAPPGPAGPAPAPPVLAEQAHRRLAEAVAALPLSQASRPYNAEPLARDLAVTPSASGDAPSAWDRQDAPWRRVRALARAARYADEVLAAGPDGSADPSLLAAGQALDRHRDAAEAAAAAAAAAHTPRIAPATAYALGVLHADQRHEVEAARFLFGRLWPPERRPA